MPAELRFESTLAAPAAEVWARIQTMEGANHELGPWIRMSVPRVARGRGIEEAPLGELAFRSWILLFGLFPLDRHSLRLMELEEGHRFLERSWSFFQRVWEHERSVEGVQGGSRLVDRLMFEPRLRLITPLLTIVIRALFRHRHRRLGRYFGGA